MRVCDRRQGMPVSITLRFLVVSMMLGVSGCSIFDAHLSSDPLPVAASASPGYVYRDLTTPWSQRTYWRSGSSVAAHGAGSADAVAGTQRTSNAYLLGRYASPERTAVVPSRPIPPAVAHSAGPVSSPAVTSAGVSYTDLADGLDAAPLPRGMSYRIWFAKGKDTLGPDGRARVARLAQNPDYQRGLWLRGHTLDDEGGDAPARFAVGRALSVRQQLRRGGFSESVRIKYHRPGVPGRYVEVTVQ